MWAIQQWRAQVCRASCAALCSPEPQAVLHTPTWLHDQQAWSHSPPLENCSSGFVAWLFCFVGKGKAQDKQAAGKILLMPLRDVTWGDEAGRSRGACATDVRMAVTGKMCSLLWCHISVVSRCYLVVLPADLLLSNWLCFFSSIS